MLSSARGRLVVAVDCCYSTRTATTFASFFVRLPFVCVSCYRRPPGGALSAATATAAAAVAAAVSVASSSTSVLQVPVPLGQLHLRVFVVIIIVVIVVCCCCCCCCCCGSCCCCCAAVAVTTTVSAAAIVGGIVVVVIVVFIVVSEVLLMLWGQYNANLIAAGWVGGCCDLSITDSTLTPLFLRCRNQVESRTPSSGSSHWKP